MKSSIKYDNILQKRESKNNIAIKITTNKNSPKNTPKIRQKTL